MGETEDPRGSGSAWRSHKGWTTALVVLVVSCVTTADDTGSTMIVATSGTAGSLPSVTQDTAESVGQATTTTADGAGGPQTGTPGDLPEVVGRAQRAMILLERAGNVLIARCMEPAGFQYFGPTDVNVEAFVGAIQLGVLTPEVAASDGYGLFLPAPPDDGDDIGQLMERGSRYFNSLSSSAQQRYLEVLQGAGDAGAAESESGLQVPMDGCLGESRSELLGERSADVFETFNRVQFLQVNIWDEPNVAQALGVWQDCMQEQGYRFESLDEAINYGLLIRADMVEASTDEIALALTDAECRIATGLIDTAERAFAEMNRAVIEENEELLITWAELEEFVLTRAGDVLGVSLAGN